MKFSRIAEKVSSEADKGSEGREIYTDRWRSDESDVDYSEEELADKNDGRWKLADGSRNFWFRPDDHEGNSNLLLMSWKTQDYLIQIVRYYLFDKLLC